MTDLTFNITLENLVPVKDPLIDLGCRYENGAQPGPASENIRRRLYRDGRDRPLSKRPDALAGRCHHTGLGKAAFTFHVVY